MGEPVLGQGFARLKVLTNLVLQLLCILIVLEVQQGGHAQFVQTKFLNMGVQVAGGALPCVVSRWIEPAAPDIVDLPIEHLPFAYPLFELYEHLLVDRDTRRRVEQDLADQQCANQRDNVLLLAKGHATVDGHPG